MDRINKFLAARSGLSRRDADKAIEAGRVRVNGKLPEGPWVQVSDKDKVLLDGSAVSDGEYFYWAFYKPVGVLTLTVTDRGGKILSRNTHSCVK